MSVSNPLPIEVSLLLRFSHPLPRTAAPFTFIKGGVMAVLNSIVMVVCALWVLVYLDGPTKRDRAGLSSACLPKRASSIVVTNK